MLIPRFCLLLLVLAFSALVHAADTPAVSIPGGVSISIDELRSEVLRAPRQAQGQLFARPENLANWAQTLLVQRELARRAEVAGLQRDPNVAAALRAARDRVLAEAMQANAGGPPPEPAALEKLARNQYNAAPEKYDEPDQVRASHILIDTRTCKPEERAKEVLALARAPNADFAALAKTHSQDPGSASRGGDLGFFPRGKMTAAFESAAFALKQPGDISDVVKTEFGYHIIRLTDRRQASKKSFEDVRDNLMKSVADGETRARRRQLNEQIGAEVQFNREAIEALVAAHGSGAAKAN